MSATTVRPAELAQAWAELADWLGSIAAGDVVPTYREWRAARDAVTELAVSANLVINELERRSAGVQS